MSSQATYAGGPVRHRFAYLVPSPHRLTVPCSDLKNPDDDDSLGVEDGGGGDEEVQAGGEEDRRSEQPVSGETRG